MANTGTQPGKLRKRLPPPLTEAQAKLAAAVHALRLPNGGGPTYEELMVELGLSKSVVAARVRKLCERKILGTTPSRHRNLYLTRAGNKALAALKQPAPPATPKA